MGALSYLNENSFSRGIRNNNPLNLRATNISWKNKIPVSENRDWSGTPANVVKQFEQFESMEDGIRAGALDLLNDYTNGLFTLRELIYERSPAHENNTENIVTYVSDATGINADANFIFSSDVLSVLLVALIQKEILPGEYNIISPEVIEDGIFLLPQSILSGLLGVVQVAGNNAGKIFLGLLVAGGAYYAAKSS